MNTAGKRRDGQGSCLLPGKKIIARGAGDLRKGSMTTPLRGGTPGQSQTKPVFIGVVAN